MTGILNMRCRYCGQDSHRLLIIALLQECGAETNNRADECYAHHEDGEPPLPHDFTDAEPVQ